MVRDVGIRSRVQFLLARSRALHFLFWLKKLINGFAGGFANYDVDL